MAGKGSKTEVSPGVWRLRVLVGYRPNGDPIQASRTFRGGARAAAEALAVFVADAAQGEVGPTGRDTVEDYLRNIWLPHIRAKSEPTTARAYESHIRAITSIVVPPLKQPLGEKKLGQLTAHDLDKAYAIWLNEGKSQATVRHRHNIIGAALQQAVKWHRLPRDVSDQASPPALRTRKVPRVRPEQVQKLIDAIADTNPTLFVAVALAASMGARRGELCGLRWGDVDWDAAVVRVERAAKYGIDGRSVVLGDVKNHTPRLVPLSSPARAVLCWHRRRVEKLAADCGVNLIPDAYILTPLPGSQQFDPTGSTPLPPDYITQAFKRVAAAQGVRVRFHDLRHYVATDMIIKGIDPRTIAGVLGHDPVVLLKTYAAFVEERAREAVDLVSSSFTIPELPS